MKTVMQKHIDDITIMQDNLEKEGNTNMAAAIFTSRQNAVSYLNEEQDQIDGAYNNGYSDGKTGKAMIDYYKRTYKNK